MKGINKVEIAIIVILLIAASCSMVFFNLFERVSAYSPHAPITINGNGDFIPANGVTNGSGTLLNPYIIEGWEIDATGVAYGISISSTDAYFVIRNTYIYSADFAGIEFFDVSNGYIDNCSISKNNWDGILLLLSSNCTIIDNDISYNTGAGVFFYECNDCPILNNTIIENDDAGVLLYYTPNTTLVENDIMRNMFDGVVIYESNNSDITGNNIIDNIWNGMYIGYSSGSKITDNNISLNQVSGIWLDNSTDSEITNNTFVDNWLGIDIEFSSNTNVTDNVLIDDGVNWWGDSVIHFNSHTITSDNMVNGKPLIYYKNSDNIEVDGALIGQLLIANCTNISVKNMQISNTVLSIALAFVENASIMDNILTYNEAGLDIEYSSNITIFRNEISNNSWDGIYLEKSENCIISGNIISYNAPCGIIVLNSSNSIIKSNNITDNEIGIELINSVDFLIYQNNFINNIDQALDNNGNENSWDNGYPIGGNYWSDYTGVDNDFDGIGDTPYVIDMDSQDQYPLMDEYIIPEFREVISPIIAIIGLLFFCHLLRKRTQNER